MVETDASDFALGCVLSQFKDKRLDPVAFDSRKLNPAERNYKIHDKELLAFLEAFKEWNKYLVGADKPVTVYTNHQNLQNFLTTKVWNQHQQNVNTTPGPPRGFMVPLVLLVHPNPP